MSLACSPPDEGMNALNHTEKSINGDEKKKVRILSRLTGKQQIIENNERKMRNKESNRCNYAKQKFQSRK